MCVEICAKDFVPECLRRFKIEALEFLDRVIVIFGKTDKCVVHRRKFKYRMSDREGVHVYQQDFVAGQLQIFRVVVTVDHVVILRNSFNEGQKLLPVLLRQVILHEPRPAESRFLDIRKVAFRNEGAVDLFQHIHVFFDTPIHALRLRCQYL